jgi:broad specificity phosphatase PhoE
VSDVEIRCAWIRLVAAAPEDGTDRMSRIYLVRHGRAAADWGSHVDPGLDDVGRAQAEAMAARLESKGPLPLVASPLRRTRETAAALERQWAVGARIEPRVGEISSPLEDLASRADWLRGIMPCRWPELDEPLRRWRESVIEALRTLSEDTVVVTHYIAINVAVGHALGDPRVTCFRPDHCSCTVLEVAASRLALIELGAQAATRVL